MTATSLWALSFHKLFRIYSNLNFACRNRACICNIIVVFPLILSFESNFSLRWKFESNFRKTWSNETWSRCGCNLPAGDVTDIDCCPELELLPLLMFCFLNCFLCFIRRFWNHVFTWVSDKCNAAASSTLSGVLRYLCISNLASKPASCWSLNTWNFKEANYSISTKLKERER